MRRALRLTAWLLFAMIALSACSPLVEDEPRSISVYATSFPIYALTDALMKDIPDAALHCLIQPQDGCLRSYRLSDWDLRLLSTSADAVIMGGRGLESFEGTLFGWGETGPAVSALLYNLELFDGGTTYTQAEDSHLEGANPHLYMSMEGAGRMIEAASAVLMTLDPGYTGKYAENEGAALAALDKVISENRALLSDIAGQPVILMNEALAYVARDYDLTIDDWIDRESGTMLYDTELQDCLDRLAKRDGRVILIERQAPAALVEGLESAGYAVAKIDILSAHAEGEGFDAYLKAQRNNAAAIRAAFDQVYGEVDH